MKQQLIKEITSKEFQHCVWTWALILLPIFSLMIFWFDYFEWVNQVAEDYPFEMTEDPNANLLYALGVLCMAFLPLYLIWRLGWGVGSYISYKLNWYNDWQYYMNTKQLHEKKFPSGAEFELELDRGEEF